MMQSEYMNEGGCVFQKFGTWGNWRMYVYIFYSVMHNNGNSMNSNSYAHTHNLTRMFFLCSFPLWFVTGC